MPRRRVWLRSWKQEATSSCGPVGGSVGFRCPDGAPFDLFAAIDGLPEFGVAEANVAVTLDRTGKKLLPMRLIMLRVSEAAAERSRRRSRRKSRKEGKTIS